VAPLLRTDPRIAAVAVVTAVVAVGVLLVAVPTLRGGTSSPEPVTAPLPRPGPVDAAVPPPGPATPPAPEDGLTGFHGTSVGGDTVLGVLAFRGNPTRTFYGVGPVPVGPEVLWRYPDAPMCSIEGDLEAGGRRWCGTGWTGQPLLRELPDGRSEVIVGAYDGAVHFVDAATGEATRPPFRTGFMVKGTETLDPDGFPLLYVGSRDGFLRAVALDRDEPTELWRLGRHPLGVWNDDWDANPTVLDDVLYAGGEDGWFRMHRLGRRYDADGLVQVAPEVLLEVPGFDDDLFARIGDRNVSIESSPAVTADRVYWVNSGGRVMGIDRAEALAGRLRITFDYWLGDDADASIVVDRDGALYVAVEYERGLPRAREVGQLVKLDPMSPGDPRVWGLDVPARPDVPGDAGGIWSTPAIHGDHLYVTTHAGDLLVVDRRDGRVAWQERIGYHEWSSPAVVAEPDGAIRLVVGTCASPGVSIYAIDEPTAPERIARVDLAGCIESTPIVWKGRIHVGSRDGFLYALG
jgi:outer membrane protein assembly factor BamB